MIIKIHKEYTVFYVDLKEGSDKLFRNFCNFNNFSTALYLKDSVKMVLGTPSLIENSSFRRECTKES
jgi:hypothetical protein